MPTSLLHFLLMLKAGQTVLVTGSCGLIGSEVATYFGQFGYPIVGVDDNHRAIFFGPEGDTSRSLDRLRRAVPSYRHAPLDIRDRAAIAALIAETKPGLLVHAAAQPSHDRAAQIPFLDFEINAGGTLNLLEAVRQSSPETVFVHLSTNKVYGDRPNSIPMRELNTRWDFDDPQFRHGIAEDLSIDRSKHSIFGASKTAADLMVQEYGRYFGIPTACLRGGCLTGPNHAGVELHGFLSYLIKCNIQNRLYTICGYKGKQVRDNIHAHDVATFIHQFAENPRVAEVYNLGGGKANSCSILEAFAKAEAVSGTPMQYVYKDENRSGDHICYYSDLRKMQAHYPAWTVTRSLDQIFEEIVVSHHSKVPACVC